VTKKLLFLDFDGVLHPNFSQEAEYFSRTRYLIDALDGFDGDIEIVVSSSWRLHWPEDVILQMLPKAIAPLVTGFTPEVEPGRHQRYREIKAYLESRSGQHDWRALDDAVNEFPTGCAELIECDGRVGLDDLRSDRLRLWLDGR
jgi:hypothetical protein